MWYQAVGAGSGSPLLVLHGGPGLPHDYLEPLTALADDRPVVFFDQLGCGRSERPVDPSLWRLGRFISEVGQVRLALGLERVHVLGHSWGAILAVEHYLAQPDGVLSLTLCSPSLSIPQWLDDVTRYRKLLPVDVQRVLDQHERNGTTDSAEYEAAVMVFYRRHLCRLNPWPECLQRAMDESGDDVYETLWGASEFHITGTLRNYDCTARLPDIRVPTLFTCGQYDEATPTTVGRFRTLIPGALHAVFENSAHVPHLEDTTEFLKTVRAALLRSDRRS